MGTYYIKSAQPERLGSISVYTTNKIPVGFEENPSGGGDGGGLELPNRDRAPFEDRLHLPDHSIEDGLAAQLAVDLKRIGESQSEALVNRAAIVELNYLKILQLLSERGVLDSDYAGYVKDRAVTVGIIKFGLSELTKEVFTPKIEGLGVWPWVLALIPSTTAGWAWLVGTTAVGASYYAGSVDAIGMVLDDEEAHQGGIMQSLGCDCDDSINRSACLNKCIGKSSGASHGIYFAYAAIALTTIFGGAYAFMKLRGQNQAILMADRSIRLDDVKKMKEDEISRAKARIKIKQRRGEFTGETPAEVMAEDRGY